MTAYCLGLKRPNSPDNSKPDKQIARIMYTMTQQMNKDYISKAMDLDKDGMGKPVTCRTCHRGHEMPEERAGSLQNRCKRRVVTICRVRWRIPAHGAGPDR